MKINEVYSALSGEGVNVGLPMTLVRLYGCNLRCSFCDSKYSYTDSEYVERNVKDVFTTTPWKKLVLITGGEPLLQLSAVVKLVKHLRLKDISVEVETNGSIAPPTWYNLVDSWSADIKCPSSGMCGKSRLDWLGMRRCDQVKFVVATEDDLEFARKTVNGRRLEPTILISPVYPWAAEWLKRCVTFCLQYDFRLSLQQHKIIFGNKRGV